MSDVYPKQASKQGLGDHELGCEMTWRWVPVKVKTLKFRFVVTTQISSRETCKGRDLNVSVNLQIVSPANSNIAISPLHQSIDVIIEALFSRVMKTVE